MSPYEINLLLHIYAVCDPIPRVPILCETIEGFCQKGWIEASIGGCGWKVTKLGKALVDRLCAVNTDGIKFCSECGQLIE